MIIQVIASFQEKYLKKLSIIVPIICVIVGFLLSKIKNDSYIPYNFDVALLLYPFFNIGGLIKQKNIVNRLLSLSKINLIIIDIVLFILTVLISYFNKEVNIYRCNYGNNILLYYLGGIFGTMMIIVTSIVVSKIMKPKLLLWLGKNTVVPMCTHQIILMFIPILFSAIGLSSINYAVRLLIEFVIVLVLVMVFTIIINKCCPFMLGRVNIHKNKK